MTLTTPAYLFLDIDGVLQTPALGDFMELEHLPLLQSWLHEHPGVYVVRACPDREGLTLAQARAWFGPELAPRVIGMTQLSVNGRAYGGRQAEIEAWMQKHAAAQAPWCALDDEALLFQPGCEAFIHVHPWTGLLPEHLEQAQRRLRAFGQEGPTAADAPDLGGGMRPLFTPQEQAHLRQGRVDVPKKAPPAPNTTPVRPGARQSWWSRVMNYRPPNASR